MKYADTKTIRSYNKEFIDELKKLCNFHKCHVVFPDGEEERVYEGVGQEVLGGIGWFWATTVNFEQYRADLKDFVIVVIRNHKINDKGYLKDTKFGNLMFTSKNKKMNEKDNELEQFIKPLLYHGIFNYKELEKVFLKILREKEKEIDELVEKQQNPIDIKKDCIDLKEVLK